MKLILSSIVVYPSVLFNPGADVHRWQVGVTAEVKASVKAMAPPRRSASRWVGRKSSGALNRSIRGTTKRYGPVQLASVVSVNVPYAHFVLQGTAFQGRRYIYSDRGWLFKPMVDAVARRVKKGGKVNEDFVEMGFYMRLPLANVGGKRPYHLRVHGQAANNFLYDGYNLVAAQHRSLKPMRNPYAF